MEGLVDVVRLSPMGLDTLTLVDDFRRNERGEAPLALKGQIDCNGYWMRVAGLELVTE